MSAKVLGKLRSESSTMVTSIHLSRFVQRVSYSVFMFSASITCTRSWLERDGGGELELWMMHEEGCVNTCIYT